MEVQGSLPILDWPEWCIGVPWFLPPPWRARPSEITGARHRRQDQRNRIGAQWSRLHDRRAVSAKSALLCQRRRQLSHLESCVGTSRTQPSIWMPLPRHSKSAIFQLTSAFPPLPLSMAVWVHRKNLVPQIRTKALKFLGSLSREGRKESHAQRKLKMQRHHPRVPRTSFSQTVLWWGGMPRGRSSYGCAISCKASSVLPLRPRRHRCCSGPMRHPINNTNSTRSQCQLLGA
mmetsp:Transcript_72980/g.84676  ORF Transcript_72980/g.84676 Transcript_72980/m.84676 type:complete len:232 (+) Transcript_72980:146-841(+)